MTSIRSSIWSYTKLIAFPVKEMSLSPKLMITDDHGKTARNNPHLYLDGFYFKYDKDHNPIRSEFD
jgi:hypothetical protein